MVRRAKAFPQPMGNPGQRFGGEPADVREHFMECPSCGHMIDCRNLGDVSKHEGAHEARASNQRRPDKIDKRATAPTWIDAEIQALKKRCADLERDLVTTTRELAALEARHVKRIAELEKALAVKAGNG